MHDRKYLHALRRVEFVRVHAQQRRHRHAALAPLVMVVEGRSLRELVAVRDAIVVGIRLACRRRRPCLSMTPTTAERSWAVRIRAVYCCSCHCMHTKDFALRSASAAQR